MRYTPSVVVHCIMCIYSVKFHTWFGELEESFGAGWLASVSAIYTSGLAVFASDSGKAGLHASCRIYLSYMSFFFVGRNLWLGRLELLLSLLSGRRRRSSGLYSS